MEDGGHFYECAIYVHRTGGGHCIYFGDNEYEGIGQDQKCGTYSYINRTLKDSDGDLIVMQNVVEDGDSEATDSEGEGEGEGEEEYVPAARQQRRGRGRGMKRRHGTGRVKGKGANTSWSRKGEREECLMKDLFYYLQRRRWTWTR